jgi:hypothetical protein
MTMHLVGPYLTTTSTKKRKNIKFKSAEHKRRYEEEQAAWTKLLKKHNIEPDTLARRKAKMQKEQEWRPTPSTPPRGSQEVPKSAETRRDHGIIPGACTKPEPKVYTGDKLIGIATMHKSNMVPVFKMEDAEDIARMRR